MVLFARGRDSTFLVPLILGYGLPHTNVLHNESHLFSANQNAFK